MATSIARKVTTAGGTTIEARDGIMTVSRPVYQAPDPKRVEQACLMFEAAAKAGDLKRLNAAAVLLRQRVNASLAGDIAPKHLLPLTRAGIEAADRTAYTIVEIVLSLLALGIPLIVDEYLHDSDAEAVLAAYESLADVDCFEATMLRADVDGHLGHDMNLLKANSEGHHALAHATGAAVRLGAPFPTIYTRTLEHSYARNDTIIPADFERSSGLLLVDRKTGELLSPGDGTRYARLVARGQAAYLACDGKHYTLAGQEVAREELQFIPVPAHQVTVRLRVEGDPELRPGMPYQWRGERTPQHVGWWGQCHASGMLVATGFPDARAHVTYYDESTGAHARLTSSQIRSLLVLYADRAFGSAEGLIGAGQLNEDPRTIDRDEPAVFHRFVMEQISAAMPFNLEEHSFDERWNYGVAGARIRATSRKRRRFGGFDTTYEMTLTKPDGDFYQYFYSIRTDREGRITGSRWNVEAGADKNGEQQAVPDAMIAYLYAAMPARTLRPSDLPASPHLQSVHVPFGFNQRAADVISDLFFASLNGGDDQEVYAVRRKDGRLERLTEAEFKTLRAAPAREAAPATKRKRV